MPACPVWSLLLCGIPPRGRLPNITEEAAKIKALPAFDQEQERMMVKRIEAPMISRIAWVMSVFTAMWVSESS